MSEGCADMSEGCTDLLRQSYYASEAVQICLLSWKCMSVVMEIYVCRRGNTLGRRGDMSES
jgi:hypothetical protein